jgi:hypothetical protein
MAHLGVFKVIWHIPSASGYETTCREAGDELAGHFFAVDGFAGDGGLEQCSEFFLAEGDVALGAEAVDEFGVFGDVADSCDGSDVDCDGGETPASAVVSESVLECITWKLSVMSPSIVAS